MYVDALSFLEDEREAWAPFEALGVLSDADLERTTAEDGPAHGWAGRDLVAHLVAWQQLAQQSARELALGDSSPTIERVEAELASDGGNARNATIQDEWRTLSLEEVRHRLATVAGELRGYLTVVPETRWVKNPKRLAFFLECTLDHYPEHQPELEAILAAARG